MLIFHDLGLTRRFSIAPHRLRTFVNVVAGRYKCVCKAAGPMSQAFDECSLRAIMGLRRPFLFERLAFPMRAPQAPHSCGSEASSTQCTITFSSPGTTPSTITATPSQVRMPLGGAARSGVLPRHISSACATAAVSKRLPPFLRPFPVLFLARSGAHGMALYRSQ